MRENEFSQGYSQTVKEIEDYFNEWLVFSKLSRNEFLQNRILRPLEIEQDILESGSLSITLFIGERENRKQIGEKIISSGNEQIEEFKITISLLLLYLGERLDEANRTLCSLAPQKDNNDYYYMTIKQELTKNRLI